MHNLYLALGTNLGDKEKNIDNALIEIEKRIGKIIASSAFYVTNPVGFESDNQFLNAACHVETLLQPAEILTITQDIERESGRDSKSTDGIYADRIIDIDLLIYDDELIVSDSLILPHPHLHEREFVLLPLVEIARDLIHPKLGRTIGELAFSLLNGNEKL